MIRKEPVPDLIRGGTGFPKRSCSNKKLERDADRTTTHPALEHDPEERKPVFGKDHAPFQSLGEQNRGEALAALDRGFVGWPPCIEKLDELLAGAVVVPLAVAFDDADQVLECLQPLALAVERQ